MIWSLVAALLLAHAGLSCLALAMLKHRKQLLPRRQLSAPACRLIRLSGWAGLLASVAVCIHGAGIGEGLPLWFGLFSLAALILILQVAFAPLMAARFALLSLGMGLVGLLLR
ncbi:DUF3325 domain-containing protein [Halopseudomonas salegens]|uniref:DUF3325 domain-containing protein n=1 Tax=Halopseudomonas salegens TaxID=1434072 RepID=A0A1H2F814_9GAMM|nr:DUF3325 domain-containing protein [Halopseudomonas salegens]SDU03472.1 Protein of unknown function [Halopseudomonas salegens]